MVLPLQETAQGTACRREHREIVCKCVHRGSKKTPYSLQLFKLCNPHLPLPPNDLLSEAASDKQRSESKSKQKDECEQKWGETWSAARE